MRQGGQGHWHTHCYFGHEAGVVSQQGKMEEPKHNLFRVLIVDDDAATRELLAEVLEAPNRSVAVRDCPRAALEFLQHNPIDLAFVDLMMPEMGGDELAKKIKERNPQAHVVLCSGYLAEA